MTTSEMLAALERWKDLRRDFYVTNPSDERTFDPKEIETAKNIARVLDDRNGWFVAPINGGGILFESDDVTIEVTAAGNLASKNAYERVEQILERRAALADDGDVDTGAAVRAALDEASLEIRALASEVKE